jgi:glucose/arabinose dehydrogenase
MRRRRRIVADVIASLLGAAGVVALPSAPVATAAVPAGFVDTVAIGGLNTPTVAAFAPDGRVFIGEKSGIVKVFDSLSDTTPTVFADLRTQTHDFWDRGLLGLAVDPQFPARPYVYVLHSYDAVPGGSAPRWGDTCPTPPGANDQGCVITGRLSKLTMGAGGVATSEQLLITDWCQQYPSHSTGTVAFGPDGALYVSGGEGASFTFADYGQIGNPCGDPPSPAGTNLSPPSAEGGALRSQSPRRPSTEPVTLGGAILRVDPDTGAGMPGNPFAGSPDANARRVIAYGLRNPFRFGLRPGSNELWVGDVGWSTWEEINRIPNAADAVAENFGWPCYEGNGRQAGYDDPDLTVCESLYSAGAGAHNAPYYTYNHGAKVVPTDPCPTGGSSISGIAFEDGRSNYPAEYAGALFFADSSRGCIWAMQTTNGQPDPAKLVAFGTGIAAPVQVLIGPGGDVFYVALGSGELRRISYSTVTVAGPSDEDPIPVIDAPTSSLQWRVNQDIPFTGHATDPQEGELPASALSWRLGLQHCSSDGQSCHIHIVQNWEGVASGSFAAPDHEYPSYLELTLTAMDSTGHTGSTTVRLDPQTVVLSFTSSPSQALLTLGGTSQPTPFTRTVIIGSNNSISAPSPQTIPPSNTEYAFVSWSDGGARTHNIVAPDTATTYEATFQRVLVPEPMPAPVVTLDDCADPTGLTAAACSTHR